MKHVLICIVFVFGCGGGGSDSGSGVDPATTLGALTPDEVTDVCEYAASLSRTVDCDGDDVESTTDVGGCVEIVDDFLDTCESTVADLEACFEDLAALSDDEVCELEAPASCSFLGDPTCLGGV